MSSSPVESKPHLSPISHLCLKMCLSSLRETLHCLSGLLFSDLLQTLFTLHSAFFLCSDRSANSLWQPIINILKYSHCRHISYFLQNPFLCVFFLFPTRMTSAAVVQWSCNSVQMFRSAGAPHFPDVFQETSRVKSDTVQS